MYQDSFLLKLNDTPLCRWTMHGLSIHVLMDTGVASTFRLLWTVLLRIHVFWRGHSAMEKIQEEVVCFLLLTLCSEHQCAWLSELYFWDTAWWTQWVSPPSLPSFHCHHLKSGFLPTCLDSSLVRGWLWFLLLLKQVIPHNDSCVFSLLRPL